MTKVVYILGYSRSGSTLLDRLLGMHPQIVSTGELNNYQRWGMLDKQYCSCGEPVPVCPFWKAVSQTFLQSVQHRDFAEQKRLQDSFERYRYLPLRPLRRSVLQMQYESYLHQVLSLYKSILRGSDASILVDSSKRFLRARNVIALAESGQLDLKLLHIVRDGRGVVWSLKKKMLRNPKIGRQKNFRPQSVAKTALAWSWDAGDCQRLMKDMPPTSAMSIRYEDLCERPQAALQRLANFVEVDAQPFFDFLSGDRGSGVAHLVAGSRHRMNADLAIRPDIEWREKLSAFDRSVFWLLAGRRAAQLGYTRKVPPAAIAEALYERRAA